MHYPSSFVPIIGHRGFTLSYSIDRNRSLRFNLNRREGNHLTLNFPKSCQIHFLLPRSQLLGIDGHFQASPGHYTCKDMAYPLKTSEKVVLIIVQIYIYIYIYVQKKNKNKNKNKQTKHDRKTE